jgi:hypothetical protein
MKNSQPSLFQKGEDLPLFSQAPPTTPSLADVIKEEAQRLDGFVYSSFPYSCGLTEALTHAARYSKPTNGQLSIERQASATTIQIKPRKGSRRRKLLTIRLWV